jgi:hypothetical protein
MNTRDKTTEKVPEIRKSYTQPMIVFETELETRAGSPLGLPDPLDPLNLEE